MTRSGTVGAVVGAAVLGPFLTLWAQDGRPTQKPGGPDAAVLDPAEIHRPDNWVAFGADIQITDDQDSRVITGKFYQDGNGSSYAETGPNPPGSPVSDDPNQPNNVITIHNVPRGTTYARSPRGVWEAHPLAIDLRLRQPKRYRYNAYVTDEPERIQGWKVVRAVNAKGSGYQLMAPDLNFAPLVWRRASDTWRLLNIRLGDPDPKLFLPEPDFAAALREAQEATHAEPLKSYVEGPFNRAIYARFAGWINECTQQTGQSFTDFDLLITVGAKGNVEALRYEPKSAQHDCFAARLRAEALPIPPKGPLVVPAGIRMNAK